MNAEELSSNSQISVDFSRESILNVLEQHVADDDLMFKLSNRTKARRSELDEMALEDTLRSLIAIERYFLIPIDSALSMANEEDLATNLSRAADLLSFGPSESDESFAGYLEVRRLVGDGLVADLIEELTKDRRNANEYRNAGVRAMVEILNQEERLLNGKRVVLSSAGLSLKPRIDAGFDSGVSSNNQVFLSYQFKDFLYAIGLYYLFKDFGFFLYAAQLVGIDIDKEDDTDLLKRKLTAEINGSAYFVVYPHIANTFRSTFRDGNTSTWCAWEIGVRRSVSKQKYLICPVEGVSYRKVLTTLEPRYFMSENFFQ